MNRDASGREQCEPLVLSVAEAARVLGLSRGTAYQLVKEGVVPSVRFGRRLLVPRRALLALLEKESGTPMRERDKGVER